MATNPAFLFYSSDFLTGCSDLTMEERGQYITLLCLQHQKGRLSKKIIEVSIGKINPDVLSKFSKDKNGLFFNKRLESEIKKREQYSEKQRDRILKRWNKSGNTVVLPKIENEIDNENENRNWNIKPDENFLNLPLPEIKHGAAKELLHFAKNIQATDEQISGLWEVFKKTNFTGKKYYQDENAAISHFLNWLNKIEPKAIERKMGKVIDLDDINKEIDEIAKRSTANAGRNNL